jgi:hypothetical protein
MARDLATFLAIMLSSNADGEILQAARQARKLLKADGHTGNDVAKAITDYNNLFEAFQKTKADRDQWRGEVERLKRLSQADGAGNSFAGQQWQTAGMPLSVDNRHAAWLSALASRGAIHLTGKEVDFVDSCARRRRLTEPRRDWLQDLVRNAVARTGEAPPP